MDYKDDVIDSVAVEYEFYMQKELEKHPKAIFYDSGQTSFYMEVEAYFYNERYGDTTELTEEDYRVLYKSYGSIIRYLYTFYLDSEYSFFLKGGNLRELIGDYVESENEFEQEAN